MKNPPDLQPTNFPIKEDIDLLAVLPKSLVDTITQVLDDKVATLCKIAPKHDIGFNNLLDILDNLETETSFNTDIFYSSLDRHVHVNTRQKLNIAKNRATNAIKQRGSITIFNEQMDDSKQIIGLPKAVRPSFISGIEEINIEEDESFRFDLNNSDEVHSLFEDIFSNLFIKLNELRKSTPSLSDIYDKKISDIELRLDFSELHGSNFVLQAIKNSNTILKIKRKSRELCSLLEEFADSPEETAAKWFYKTNQIDIEELIQESVNLYIIETMTENYAKLDKSLLKKEKTKPKNVEQQSKKRKKHPNNTATDHNQTIELNTSQKDQEQQGSRTTNTKVSIGWINDGEPTLQTIETIFLNNKTTGIIYAIDPKLVDVAEETLEKAELSNKIHNAIKHQATALANGINPWDSNSSAKRVNKKKHQTPPEFQDETIYYTYDLRPNAPRVYFVIKQASELLNKDQLNQEILSQDSPCMIILAITDKQNQVEILQRLTGKQHKDLRSKGTGAI